MGNHAPFHFAAAGLLKAVEGAHAWAAAIGGMTNVDYAQDLTGSADKLTYMTPVFNGVQAGVSYTFDTAPNSGYAPSFGVRQDDQDAFGEA